MDSPISSTKGVGIRSPRTNRQLGAIHVRWTHSSSQPNKPLQALTYTVDNL